MFLSLDFGLFSDTLSEVFVDHISSMDASLEITQGAYVLRFDSYSFNSVEYHTNTVKLHVVLQFEYHTYVALLLHSTPKD